jgi:ubiquinone biosynthesis protein Coq4
MNAFSYAQCFSPTTCLLMAAKLVRAINGPENVRIEMMNNIVKGYQFGQEAYSLIAIALEEYWEAPLCALRLKWGIPVD